MYLAILLHVRLSLSELVQRKSSQKVKSPIGRRADSRKGNINEDGLDWLYAARASWKPWT